MLCRSERDDAGGAPRRHRWVVAIAAIGLIAAHGLVLQYILSHAAISTRLAVGVFILIVLKDPGLLSAALAAIWRFWRNPG